MTRLIEEALALLAHHRKIAVATVVSDKGSTPRNTGAKMIVLPDGQIRHSVGGGIFESIVTRDALEALRTDQNTLKAYSFNEEGKDAIGAVCGGTIQVYIEIMKQAPALVVVGGGHVGQALARAADLLDFRITVVDDRPEFAGNQDLPESVKCIHTPENYSAIPDLEEGDFICLVSKGVASDAAALERVIDSPARYIGMIGSSKKIRTAFDDLKAKGVDPKLFDRVNTPIGLDIHSESPEEIAISILAEIIRVKNSPA